MKKKFTTICDITSYYTAADNAITKVIKVADILRVTTNGPPRISWFLELFSLICQQLTELMVWDLEEYHMIR